jgi:hypothetical protein
MKQEINAPVGSSDIRRRRSHQLCRVQIFPKTRHGRPKYLLTILVHHQLPWLLTLLLQIP